MGNSILEIALIAIGSGLLGAAGGWLVHTIISNKRLDATAATAQAELEDITTQRNQFARGYARAQQRIKSLQVTNAKQKISFDSLRKKSKLLANNILTLRSERENTKTKLGALQNALSSFKQRTNALQSEFEKTQAFYKRELTKTFEKRKLLEQEVKDARSEQESFAELVESATLEHGSEENMVVAAQLRLGQLKVLEKNVNKLETENSELNAEIVRLKKEFGARERDLAELDELKIHNEQLLRGIEALEGSRKEHESDAERFRQQADQSEKQSDTLRLKLADLQENFAEIEKQQDQVLESARKAAVVPMVKNRR
jgi:chromosome segregation ATPase